MTEFAKVNKISLNKLEQVIESNKSSLEKGAKEDDFIEN